MLNFNFHTGLSQEHFAKSTTDHFNNFVEVMCKDIDFQYIFMTRVSLSIWNPSLASTSGE